MSSTNVGAKANSGKDNILCWEFQSCFKECVLIAIVCTHLGDEGLEGALSEDPVVARLVRGRAHLEELARSHAPQQLLRLVVEGGGPGAPAVVDQRHVQYVAVIALHNIYILRKRNSELSERIL